MDEFSLINKIKQKYYRQSSLIKGIGDDAAVFREIASDLVVAVDTFVEGVHFTKETMDSFYVGYRGLAANLSDLAAMGAIPMYYLVSITVPKNWDELSVLGVFEGMKVLADTFRTDLLGGDTVSGDSLVLSITVIGKTAENKARYRHDAKPGDVLFVTGTLGDSRAGLDLIQGKTVNSAPDHFLRRHRRPEPRIAFSQLLTDLDRVALNDISDGLASEANEIAEAAGVTIIIEDDAIPVHSAYKEFPYYKQFNWKYFGGEDFELVGATSKENWYIVKEAAEQLNLRITKIGYVTSKEETAVYLKQKNEYKRLSKAGYTHLK